MVVPKDRERVLAGRYRLVRALGTGGMGTVWLAEDDLLHRRVAVKEVAPPAEMTEAEREMLRQRTLREARTAARLSHANVVTIYDVVEDGDQPWIVMELVSARSLRDIVQEDGPLTPQQAAGVALQVLAALRAAHALGIVHRDVKPGNVLIESEGRAVLADFGIARGQDSSTITTSGILVGSPSYIAPERAHGERGGPESDLWSLGATLYSAVEGRPPYDRSGALATLTAVVTQDPDPPVRAGRLWPVISGLLCRDPARRLGPADAERMLRGIAETDEAAGTEPLPASAEPVVPSEVSQGGRLEHADRTLAFHPHPPPAAPPPQAAAPMYPVTDGDATATPPGALPPLPPQELPGTSAAATRQPAPAPAPAPAARNGPSAAPRSPAPPADAPEPAGPVPVPGTPGRSASAREPGQAGTSQRRRLLRWMITAATAVLAVTAALVALNVPGRHAAPPSPRPDNTAGPDNSARPAASKPTGSGSSPSPGSSAVPQPGATTGAAAAAVPAGYHRYRDVTGFSIGVPDGWTVSHQGTYVYVTPASGGSFLLIDQTDHPNPDPLANWRQQEANRIGTYPGYHRIRLQSIRYPQAEKAADWEFTYYKNGILTHVLNRNVLANAAHAYALYWSTPETEWNADFRIFEAFARTFEPAAP